MQTKAEKCSLNIFGWFAPNITLSISRSELQLLLIRPIVKSNNQKSSH